MVTRRVDLGGGRGEGEEESGGGSVVFILTFVRERG